LQQRIKQNAFSKILEIRKIGMNRAFSARLFYCIFLQRYKKIRIENKTAKILLFGFSFFV